MLFSTTKEKIWNVSLDLSSSSFGGCGEVRIDRFRASKIKEALKVDLRAKKTVFGQIYQQINHKDSTCYRIRKGERAWRATFLGEFSDDYGGPYRASLDDIGEELQSNCLQLLIPCPNRKSLFRVIFI
jgi:hypothetical protein